MSELKVYELEFTYFTPSSGRVPVLARSPEEARNKFMEQDPTGNALITALTEIGLVTEYDEPARIELTPPSFEDRASITSLATERKKRTPKKEPEKE